MKKFILGMVTFFVFSLVCMGASQPEVYFNTKDPVGDEHGYGTYQYPTNIAFKPYQGLYDITEFKVAPGETGMIYFDTCFMKVTNPWAAPEGFIHQNLRIFIDTKPNQGLTILAHPGANVKFNPKYGWEVELRIVGWGSSQLLILENSNTLKAHSLKVELLNDQHTIRACVPENLIGRPTQNWHYYVMVGSYDGFGEDFFRKVSKRPGEWIIGGGRDLSIEPRVMDLLAPPKGVHNQTKQLGSFNPQTSIFAELYPVGRDIETFNPILWLAVGVILLIIMGIIYLIIKKPGRICWFWVRQPIDGVFEK